VFREVTAGRIAGGVYMPTGSYRLNSRGSVQGGNCRQNSRRSVQAGSCRLNSTWDYTPLSSPTCSMVQGLYSKSIFFYYVYSIYFVMYLVDANWIS
jgi:hypothetical protein